MIGAPRSMAGVMLRDGDPVHGNDFKCSTLKLKVEIAIRRSVDKAPKLALTRSDFNFRPYGTVQGEDFFWRLWLRTTDIRTEFNAALQISRLRIVHNGTATHNQHALRQVG